MKKTIPIRAASPESIPIYATPHAAGADVRAHIDKEKVILPGESTLIPTGLWMEIPEGFEIQVRPRSGLALHHQITVLNSPGTVDADYRGEIGVILINHGTKPFIVIPNMRIAQIVFVAVMQAEFVVQEEALSSSLRGEGGFGHSGIT